MRGLWSAFYCEVFKVILGNFGTFFLFTKRFLFAKRLIREGNGGGGGRRVSFGSELEAYDRYVFQILMINLQLGVGIFQNDPAVIQKTVTVDQFENELQLDFGCMFAVCI